MSEPIKLDLEAVKKGLQELAEEKPDFVYQGVPDYGCLYLTYGGDDGQPQIFPGEGEDYCPPKPAPIQGPGCGVGHLLVRAGVDPEVLRDHENSSAGVLPYWASVDAAEFARDFQQRQDRGIPWGEAFKGAVSAAEAFADKDEEAGNA